MSLTVGIDIGGTNLRIGVVDGLRVVHERRIAADFSELCRNNPPDIAWPQIINLTSSMLEEVFQQFPGISSVGIGFPGFIDPATGCIVQSPNLPGLSNVDLAGDLARAVGRPIMVENDALAAAYGEFRLNGASDTSSDIKRGNLVYIGLGTGVGGGLVYANRPFAGEHGVAMEIGHLIVESPAANPKARLCGCGNRGCLEQYASATGVAISYEILSGKQMEASQIAILAGEQDHHALAAYALAGEKLGQALAHILKVVDVSHVVIGGGMSPAWPLMQPAFEQHLQADLIAVLRNKIVVQTSSNDDRAGIIGAALLSSLING
jgi:glucokinase